MRPCPIWRIGLTAEVLLQGVTIRTNATLVFHQYNPFCLRTDHIRVKKAPHAMSNHRLHGSAPPAHGKHTLRIMDSDWDQSHTRFFPLLTFEVAEVDRLATCDEKFFNIHLSSSLGRPRS